MDTLYPNRSASLSTMISEATYRVVVGVERLARRSSHVFQPHK